ncbi:hypothetical protein GCM10011571_27650 [Marinithermofilum abyssi]|uniref:Uncharacterized protein n=1 Tax=Marinithermofilum abyssi TaxID=1571185 RepID=A0A8J2VIJ5_9BACL|nr:hypothetical protein [Marinithermofilum abyssi]GGE24000.1 hypothetical protein GCM10011571_27650 [Marinithermofilum abyssi]
MGKEQEVAYLLFDLLVRQLETMAEQERRIQRLEVFERRLDLTLKDGSAYVVDVRSREEEVGEMTPTDGIHVSEEKWQELVQACQSVMQFLEYDKEKLRNLERVLPDFPWERRARMVERLLEQLDRALKEVKPGEEGGEH